MKCVNSCVFVGQIVSLVKYDGGASFVLMCDKTLVPIIYQGNCESIEKWSYARVVGSLRDCGVVYAEHIDVEGLE